MNGGAEGGLEVENWSRAVPATPTTRRGSNVGGSFAGMMKTCGGLMARSLGLVAILERNEEGVGFGWIGPLGVREVCREFDELEGI